MQIAVISDSHLYEPGRELETVYAEYLADADHLVHCGDITSMPVWQFLMQHPSLHAVHGNMCDWHLARELPDRINIRLGPLTMGVTHGWGSRTGLSRRVFDAFGGGYDLICFGHTHEYEWVRYDATWMLNPGSLRSGSLALLDVDEQGGMTPRRIKL